MDVEHGSIQQGVDVLETLQPRLQAPSALRLQLPQLLLRQPGQRRRRGRHGRHCGGGGGKLIKTLRGSILLAYRTQQCFPVVGSVWEFYTDSLLLW